MKKSILRYINKLQSYKTAIKNIHWSSSTMSEHKLFDDIDESVSNIQDEIAEMAQGIYGKLKFNDLTPKKYKITTSKKMLQDMLNDTKLFLSTLRSKELVGIKSEVESFVGEINQYMYLLDFCLKEDLKRILVPTSRRFEKAYKTFKYFSSSPVKADDYAIVSLLLPLVNFSKSDERLRDYENLCHDKKISGLKFNKMKEKEYIVNFW